MRYSILGFNQEELIKYNIDMTDVLLLDYIQKALSQPSMVKSIKDEQPYVWLQHKKILEDLPILNIKESMLKKRIAKLVETGLIKSLNVADACGRGSRSYYTITESFESLQMTGCKKLHLVEQPSVKNYTSSSGPSVKNYTPNNKLNNNKHLIDIDKSISKDNNRQQQWFLDTYHSICVSLPKVRSVTTNRKKAIDKIMKSYSKEDIIEAFKIAEESDFLKGNNDTGWKATIDFILREDKFVSILEGKYGNKKKKRFELEGNTDPYTEEDKQEDDKWREEMRKNGKPTTF